MKKDIMKNLMTAFQEVIGEMLDSQDIDSEEFAKLSIHGEEFMFPLSTLEAMEDYLGHEIDKMGLS